jgi:hypothetical protein
MRIGPALRPRSYASRCHLNAWCISKSKGLFSCFFTCPHPRSQAADVADNRLAALGDVEVLNGHLLFAAASVSLQCLDLRCEGVRELVEGIRGAIRPTVGLSRAAVEQAG